MSEDFETFEKELDEVRQSDHESDVLEEAETEEKPEETTAEEPIEEPQEVVEEKEEVVAEAQPEEQPEEVQPEAERYTIPDDQKFGEFAGKKLTAAEMEDAGLLRKFNTLENNDVHHQKLYGEVKEKYDALLAEKVQKLEEDAQPRQPQIPVVEQIKNNLAAMTPAYMPNLKSQAEAGAFEEDFLVMFPDLAVQMEHRFVAGNAAIETLAKKVAEQESFINALLGVVEEASNSERFTGSIDTMVSDNPERYGLLREGTNQNDFVSWMNAEDNPMGFAKMAPETITPAVLAQAFLGFIDANQGLVSASQGETVVAKVPANTGGGSGTGVTRSRPAPSEMDTFERAFEEAQTSSLP